MNETDQKLSVITQFESAQQLLNSGQTEQALTALNQVLEANALFPDAHRLRGASYYGLGKYAEARADLEKAVELNPRDHEAHFLLGETIKDMNLQLDATSTPPAHWKSVGGEALHDPEMLRLAAEHITLAIHIEPIYFYLYQRAQLYEILGEYRAALDDYDAVWSSNELEMESYRDAALLGKAKMLMAVGDEEQGRELIGVYNQHQDSKAQHINADALARRYLP